MIKKTFIILIVFSLTISIVNAQLRTFISVQEGTDPVNGEILQTNGSNSSWVATTTLGITIGGATSTNPFMATFFTATSTSQSSTFPYASTTAISSSGDAWFATSGGNVGIGTTGPNEQLELTGNIRLAVDKYISWTNGNNRIDYDGSAMRFLNCGNIKMRMSTGGLLVGVDANPASVLDVEGGVSVGASYSGTTAAPTNGMIIEGNVGIGTTSPWGVLSVTNTTANPSFIVEDSTSPDTSPFVIDASGNVGIGTTGPGTKLDVIGTATTLANIQANVANNAINITSTYTAGADYAPGLSWSASDNSPLLAKAGIWSRFTASGSYLYFGTSNAYGSGISNSAMVIDYSGNVGIGSTTPSSILSIGTANASTTITMGKMQWQGQNSAGAVVCKFVVGTTEVIQLGACNP